MIGRRGFLGTIIGICTATMLPFKAIEAEEGSIIEAKPIGDLDKFRIGITMVDGLKIWAPGIKDVIVDGYKITFKASDIKATRSWTVKGMFLYSPKGRICAKKDFACTVPMVDGDTLKVQYYIDMPGCDPQNWAVWEPIAAANLVSR